MWQFGWQRLLLLTMRELQPVELIIGHALAAE